MKSFGSPPFIVVFEPKLLETRGGTRKKNHMFLVTTRVVLYTSVCTAEGEIKKKHTMSIRLQPREACVDQQRVSDEHQQVRDGMLTRETSERAKDLRDDLDPMGREGSTATASKQAKSERIQRFGTILLDHES